MLLSQSQVKSLQSKKCNGCRGISGDDVEYLMESYHRLLNIITRLKTNSVDENCWCPDLQLREEGHTNGCREIQRLFT